MTENQYNTPTGKDIECFKKMLREDKRFSKLLQEFIVACIENQSSLNNS